MTTPRFAGNVTVVMALAESIVVEVKTTRT